MRTESESYVLGTLSSMFNQADQKEPCTYKQMYFWKSKNKKKIQLASLYCL